MENIKDIKILDNIIEYCHTSEKIDENLDYKQLADWLEELKWFKSIALSKVDEIRLTELAEEHTAFIKPEAISEKVIGEECFKIGYRLGRKEPTDEVLDKAITLGDIFTGFYIFFAETPDKCALHDKNALREVWNHLDEVSDKVKAGDWKNVFDIMDSKE